ncbi:hypothetical protein [Fibrivirga algicola]|uniref:Uncharacterized protein n=1 Tax=Fibrivirga algicola TaxID=2950420 RepID=A0ABX0QKS1_9BACT|nr:hypothetical protein [Fibrivirga algicola]NID13025.1 hypothetical protein [Fibrivirga algicola]
MKSIVTLAFAYSFVLGATQTTPAQTPNAPAPVAIASVSGDATTDRVSFMLKNTLGYHRMFRVEGPGIAYGFTMNKRETIPCNWPVGSKLYFSNDGETTKGLILTVSAADGGKTLTTGEGTADKTRDYKPAVEANAGKITFVLHSTSLLPRKLTLISYEPTATGNGTTGFMIGPKGNKRFSFPVGTKLYLANSEQVDVVMSGKRIDAGKPFLVVKKEDAGRVIDLD